MSTEWLSKTELLPGNEKLEQLKNSHVLIVGLGGVGAIVLSESKNKMQVQFHAYHLYSDVFVLRL